MNMKLPGIHKNKIFYLILGNNSFWMISLRFQISGIQYVLLDNEINQKRLSYNIIIQQ